MDIKTIYEDNDLLVVDKPAGFVVFAEEENSSVSSGTFLINKLIKRYQKLGEVGSPPRYIKLLLERYPKLGEVGSPPRYGIVHRLDKDTSGILLVAKTNEALIFLQNQFSVGAKALADKRKIEPIEKNLEKRYIALATGVIKEDSGRIETFIGRSPADPRKQKAYPTGVESSKLKVKREAVTEYKVLSRFNEYTLLEVTPKTGRKHQIRCHLAHIHHPIAGDKIYGFKDSSKPEGLTRQFLHASYLKIKMPNGEIRELKSALPNELSTVLEKLKSKNTN